MSLERAKQLFLRKTSLAGYILSLVGIAFGAIGRWGDVEFAASKRPWFEDLGIQVWRILTDDFYSTIAIIVIGLSLIWWGAQQGLKAASQYQPAKKSDSSLSLSTEVHLMLIRGGPLARLEWNTHNQKDSVLGDERVIGGMQAARFIEPVEKIIRVDGLPAFVSCEPRLWKRARNHLLGVPQPRIVVKQFTNNGILFDEENTQGLNVVVELYGKETSKS